MIKISRGIILIIMGIIFSLPVAKAFQIFLPSAYGLILAYLIGPGLLIVGAVFVIKDRKSLKAKKEIVSDQTEFCGKCGNEVTGEDTFCTNCGQNLKAKINQN